MPIFKWNYVATHAKSIPNYNADPSEALKKVMSTILRCDTVQSCPQYFAKWGKKQGAEEFVIVFSVILLLEETKSYLCFCIGNSGKGPSLIHFRLFGFLLRMLYS